MIAPESADGSSRRPAVVIRCTGVDAHFASGTCANTHMQPHFNVHNKGEKQLLHTRNKASGAVVSPQLPYRAGVDAHFASGTCAHTYTFEWEFEVSMTL